MTSFGNVPASSVLPIFFNTFNSSGASVTITGLATSDIEIYKGTSMTQRSSDAGYTLLDMDGIDVDSITGIHGFSIDLGDNTDAGFYTAGSFYTVVVSAITADSQTISFVAATFRIVGAENTSGTPVVDVGRISGDATAADNAEAFFDGTGYAGTNNVIPTVTTLTNVPANFTSLSITAGGVVKSDVDTIKTQSVTASGGITFPAATLASTSNIDDMSTNVYDSITTHVWEAVASTYGTGDTTAGRLNAIKAKTDLIIADMATIATRLLTAMELDGSVYRFTTNALEQAPGGGSGTSEAFLTYDWDGIVGEPAHCLLNALRVILNKKTQSPGYINVLKEDGATTAFQVPITTAVSPAVGVTETGVPAQ